jgi:Domain of unknown function (DUF4178)
LETNSNIPPTSKKCYQCNAAFNSYLNSNAYTIICPKCGLLYHTYNGILEKTLETVSVPIKELTIPLGTKGNIQSIEYIVIGYTNKVEYGSLYYWEEYTLFNPIHGIAYLSQFNGHWIYLKEMDTLPSEHGRSVKYKNTDYRLYARYKSKINRAVGEFQFYFSKTELPMVEEFINGTSMISKEKTKDGISWFQGEYVDTGELKKNFNITNLPKKEGVGMLQPFIGKFKVEFFKKVLILLTLLWGGVQIYFSSYAKEEVAFSQSFSINDSLNKKEIYSKPFALKYGTANAEIKIATNVDNNWMYTAITLVNEKTGDVYNVDLEAEYYHGYEGGESWSEGNSWVSKVVSQVPEGTYYLIIYPDKPATMSYVSLEISVTRDVFVFSNGLFVLLVLAIFPIFYFYRKGNFEKKRWYNSNYSPYNDED